MKVLRSTFVAAIAIFAAACGDKVTVAPPPTENTTPSVTSVTVTPASVTLSIGQSVTFTAVVDVKISAATTVTWSSASAAVTVTAAGAATAASATPGTAVCATSTADANKKGCATVVVTPATAVIPATVSIQSVTVGCPVAAGTCGLNVPVNPLAVTGNIDVTANVSPGNETVTKVVALVGTTRTDSQTFTAANAAALRFAADEAIANQSAFPPITFSINTAKFNATTGVAAWTNGSYPVSLQLYVSGNTSARSTATYQTPLTFANANTYVLTSSFSGTTASATSGAGYSYKRGSIAASVLPVIYTPGITMAAGSITFGSTLATTCDRSGTGPRTGALTAPAAGSSAWTATIVYTPGSGALTTDADLYEYDNTVGTCAAATLATGEGFTVAATDNNGNGFLAGAAPSNAAANLYRVDNRPPVAPTSIQNPNSRAWGWINAGVGMTSVNTGATSNNWMVNGAAVGCATTDCGVGGYVRQVRIAAATGLLVDAALAATPSNTPTLPAPSVTDSTYCAVFSATDLLGNESARPAAGTACLAPVLGSFTAAGTHQMFGVDIAPPQIAFSGGLAASSAGVGSTGASVLGEFQVTVSDTGIIGNSGMTGPVPLRASVTIRTPTAGITGAAAGCIVGTFAAGACGQSGTGVGAPAFPLIATATVSASTVIGYYTFTGNSVDAAGNVSGATVTRVRSYDPVATTPSLTAALFNTPISGTSVTFNANGSDDLDLWKVNFRLTYGATDVDASGTPDSLYLPSTTLQTFNTAPFVKDNVGVPVTINNFMRAVQMQTNACATFALTATAATRPDGLHENLLDMLAISSALVSTVIPAAAIPTIGTYVATGSTATQAQSFYVSNGVNATTCANTVVATGISKAGTTAGAPTSVTINADVFGATAVFNAPFARVDFYAQVGTSVLEQIGTTTTYSTVDDGSANGRRHRYSLSWTPGASSPITGTAWPSAAAPGTPVRIIAVGVNAAGDALIGLSNVNIGLVP
jgi:hypothetical protein